MLRILVDDLEGCVGVELLQKFRAYLGWGSCLVFVGIAITIVAIVLPLYIDEEIHCTYQWRVLLAHVAPR